MKSVVEETEEALKAGYLGMKYKVGRGWKWMEKDAGLQRDIEVIQGVRKAAGRSATIMADANNGHKNDFERRWRFLQQTREANLYWSEELFPEDVAQYAKLQDQMRDVGMKTFLADGENMRKPDQFKPYLKPRRLIDVLQMDIRRGGFIDNVALARMGEEVGAVLILHNWGAQVGLYMGLQLAKAVKSVPIAEDDRSTCDVLQAEGYSFRSGHYRVGDSPGLGLRIDEKSYKDKYQGQETVVS